MPKYNLIKLDETKYWNPGFVKEFEISKLMGVYVFNPEESTNCCEITPSFALHFVNTQIEHTENASEEMIENASEEVVGNDCEQEPVTYMHCCCVNKLEKIELGEFENIDEAIEDCNANCR